jgi:hypothetical protein
MHCGCAVATAVRSRILRSRRERAMELIQIVVLLIVIGVLLWAVNQYLPMDEKIKSILNVVVVLVVVFWLLALFFPGLSRIRVPPP